MPEWNVLLVTFDQWRGDCLSAAGHPVLRTPHLDALAAEGVLFRRHFAQAVPCGPSRASLWTGMYLQNHRSGTNGTPLDARFTNLALEVRKLGYKPALFGYTDTTRDPRHLDDDDPLLENFEQALPGMDEELMLGTNIGLWLDDLKRKGYEVPERQFDIFLHRNDRADTAGRAFSYAPPVYKAEDSDSRFLTDQVQDYIDEHRGEGWFVHASYLRPHPPFVVAEPYHDRYKPGDVTPPVRAASVSAEQAVHPYLAYQIDNNTPHKWCESVSKRPSDMTDGEIAQLRATYYGMINEVEDNFDRLIDYLKTTGEYDRTLIIVTSDHGEYMGDHYLLGKSGWFDCAYHIPLIVRDPRTQADAGRGRIVDAFSENIDLMPTVLKWLSADIPRQCDGRSLLPWLDGGTPADWRQETYYEFDFRDVGFPFSENALGLRPDECGISVLRGERYKYVHFTSLPPLLFDLETDPGELHNCIDDPAYAGVALAFARKMLSCRMSNDERVLTNTVIDRGAHEYPDERRGFRSDLFDPG